jgi:membrane-bound lytic murein transglycosylase MltF
MDSNPSFRRWLAASLLVLLAGCGGDPRPATPADGAATATTAAAPGASTATTAPAAPTADLAAANGTPPEDTSGPPELPSILDFAIEPHVGDLDRMIERRQVRMLVAMDRTHFYFDGGALKGITADAIREFETWMNAQLKQPKNLKVQAVIVPVRRDQLIPALLAGRGDVIATFMTATDERRKQVTFPAGDSVVNEVLVLPKGAAVPAGIEQLAGTEVHVRPSSSYHDSLVALNARFAAAKLAPVRIVPLDENLNTDEALEMLNAGLIPATVADRYVARLWKSVLPDIQVVESIRLRSDGRMGWAVRPDNPQLAKLVGEFQVSHGKGTLWGNMMAREFAAGDFIRNPESEADRARLVEIAKYFREYGDRYSMDWLLVAAQAYQESRLDQNAKSAVGAIGVMQVMPGTANDPRVGIPDIHKVDRNIEAGVKYMRFVIDRYYADEPMTQIDKGLFALASYNAGPARVAKLRAEAEKIGLDPNVWFQNVEVVAARRIGAETVTYVRNIYKYYLTYKLINAQAQDSAPAKPAAAPAAARAG